MTRFDLHVHTALSACAENTMSPCRIIARAHGAGLGMVGITDHNASANVRPTLEQGRRYGICVVPGVEMTSREEAHVLVLFDRIETLDEWQQVIDDNLPAAANVPDIFGDQVVYSCDDEIVALDERLRQVGVNMGLSRVVEAVHERGGVVIPSHVFRNRHSLTSQLGLIDADAGYDALETRWRDWQQQDRHVGDCAYGYPVITGSDAHFLEDVGRVVLEVCDDVTTVSRLLASLRKASA